MGRHPIVREMPTGTSKMSRATTARRIVFSRIESGGPPGERFYTQVEGLALFVVSSSLRRTSANAAPKEWGFAANPPVHVFSLLKAGRHRRSCSLSGFDLSSWIEWDAKQIGSTDAIPLPLFHQRSWHGKAVIRSALAQ